MRQLATFIGLFCIFCSCDFSPYDVSSTSIKKTDSNALESAMHSDTTFQNDKFIIIRANFLPSWWDYSLEPITIHFLKKLGQNETDLFSMPTQSRFISPYLYTEVKDNGESFWRVKRGVFINYSAKINGRYTINYSYPNDSIIERLGISTLENGIYSFDGNSLNQLFTKQSNENKNLLKQPGSYFIPGPGFFFERKINLNDTKNWP